MARIAIVGAGLTGLVLARRLAPRHAVSVYEKSRGPGGRMATRYAGDFEFDHGAQFFTATSEAFRTFLGPLVRRGLVAPWCGRFVEISADGAVADVAPGTIGPRYVGVPRMNVVGKALAEGLDVRYGTHVQRVERTGKGWSLDLGPSAGRVDTDWLLVTAPVPQARALLADVEAFGPVPGERRMQGCFALMLGFESLPRPGFDAARIEGADIGWIALNDSKPGRGREPTMVVHSTNAWADANIDRALDSVEAHLACELARVTGVRAADAVHRDVHRWRYANAPAAGGRTHCLLPDERLGVAGDAWIRGRVEAAFLSADALATQLDTVLSD